MGIVYEAQWNATPVAFKEIMDCYSDEVLSDVKREVQTMMNLRHPNIVLLMGVCVEPLALVVELVKGGWNQIVFACFT